MKFNNLNDDILTNTKSTRYVCILAQSMKNIVVSKRNQFCICIFINNSLFIRLCELLYMMLDTTYTNIFIIYLLLEIFFILHIPFKRNFKQMYIHITYKWKFDDTNSQALMSLLPFDNRKMFSIDLSNIDMKEYIR